MGDRIMINKILPLVVCAFLSYSAFAADGPSYQLSTHILDISQGEPARNVSIVLSRLDPKTKQWKVIDNGITDANGRIADFLPEGPNNFGTYKLTFETQEYFKDQKQSSIYPYVDVIFSINDNGHYHIPITMSANGYATYRGN